MLDDDTPNSSQVEAAAADVPQHQGLLIHDRYGHDDLNIHSDPTIPTRNEVSEGVISTAQDTSSDTSTQPLKIQNRVHFDITEESSDVEANRPSTAGRNYDWLNEDDYMDDIDGRGHSEGHQTAPLLTDIEAPSVTVATSSAFSPENAVGDSQHTSGLRSAFMNMANSIIGAGIIGQPYALRQAGMLTGFVILVGLTIVVDWTIRLIVINSKLSGADSFQATVERCFGRPGFIAISLAQWAFAFGGMIAFCIIVGDTIPHVLMALFPSLEHIPHLSAVRVLLAYYTGSSANTASTDHNSLLIYGSLKKPTLNRFALVTHYSTGISMCFCLVMAVGGFLTFGSETEGNVLNNFPSDNIVVNVARL
ncbi:hypothetical protein KEM54_005754 [Ascosphaera aggregata]|nr:hypothetical protein KEM54_005754 [Ascosphaera aggregata]